MKINIIRKNLGAFFGFVVIVIGGLYFMSWIWGMESLWIQDDIIRFTEKNLIPGIYETRYRQSDISFKEKILQWTIHTNPLLKEISGYRMNPTYAEDEETIAMILEKQANEENHIDENGNLVIHDEISTEKSDVPIHSFDIEELKNFDTLLNRFYIVDSTTTIDESQLNYDDLMSRDMKINLETEGPKVLIYHTHSQEAFADSASGDPNTSIVGMGGYLTELLNEKGISTIHDEGVYDVIDGKLDRSKAYDYAKERITTLLAENPSVEVVIDLHRDGVGENTHLVSDINGKPTAKIMFFNGLSRSATSGEIEYLYNPYIQDNLSFSFQMQLACEQMYPGWARKIYLRAYRYNLHLMPKDLLIEAGAQTNTVEEMKNAMELLSNTLCSVLKG